MIIVGRAASRQFVGLVVGTEVGWGENSWRVVGLFVAGGSAAESGALVWQNGKLDSSDRGLAQSAERTSGGKRTGSQNRMIKGGDNLLDKHWGYLIYLSLGCLSELTTQVVEGFQSNRTTMILVSLLFGCYSLLRREMFLSSAT